MDTPSNKTKIMNDIFAKHLINISKINLWCTEILSKLILRFKSKGNSPDQNIICNVEAKFNLLVIGKNHLK